MHILYIDFAMDSRCVYITQIIPEQQDIITNNGRGEAECNIGKMPWQEDHNIKVLNIQLSGTDSLSMRNFQNFKIITPSVCGENYPAFI